MAMNALQKLVSATDAALVRRPLPLRLVRSSWLDAASGDGSLLVVCKPCAMPLRTEEHHRRVQQSPQRYHVPHHWDVGDSFMNRVHDNMHPAATPYHVPFGTDEGCYYNDSVDFLSRGLEVVVRTREDATFVATCMQLGLVSCTYHVLVHVPPCVHSATMDEMQRQQEARASLQSSYKNPFLREHLMRLSERQQGDVVVAPEVRPGCSDLSAVWNLGLFGPHGTLASSGQIVCRIGTGAHTEASASSSVASTKRLRDLFVTAPPKRFVTAGASCATSSACCQCAKRDGLWSDGVTPPSLQTLCVTAARAGDERTASVAPKLARARKGTLKAVSFDFRLLNVSPRNSLALYEVTTHSASERDVLAVFGHHNLFVVGDAAYNPTLYSVARLLKEHLCAVERPRGASGIDVHRMKGLPADVAVSQLLLFPPPTCDERRTLRTESAALMASILAARASSIPRARNSLEISHAYAWLSGFGFGLARTKLTLPKAGSEANGKVMQEIVTRQQLGRPLVERQTLRDRMEFTAYRSCPSAPEGFQEYLIADGQPTPSLRSGLPFGVAGNSDTVSSENGLHEHTSSISVAVPKTWGAADEERGFLFCDHCNQGGHTLSSCSRVSSIPPLRRSLAVGENAAQPTVSDGDELPSTLAELKLFLAAQDLGTGAGDAHEVVTLVPNTTLSRRPAFSWKRRADATTPHLHRKREPRCSHCSGRHWVSECPALGDKPMGVASHTLLGTSTADRHEKSLPADRLFCIRCGGRGHLYGQCPTTTGENLGSAPSAKLLAARALRCPICAVPLSVALHTPEACPRRFEPPPGFSPTGVHRDVSA